MSAPIIRVVLAGLLACVLSACYSEVGSSLGDKAQGGIPRTQCNFGYEPTRLDCEVTDLLHGCLNYEYNEDFPEYPDYKECRGVSCDSNTCSPTAPSRLAVRRAATSIKPAPQAAVAASERTALLAIYDATGGSSWYNKTNWGGAAGTECTWYGVKCNADGSHVIELHFDFNNLHGTLPAAIADLTELQKLFLDEFYLTGLPVELGNLAHLEELDLFSIYAMTTLPASLGNLPSLKRLHLEGLNSLNALPPSLGNLPSLEQLELLDLPSLATLPAELGNLPALQTLRISELPLTTFPAFIASLDTLRGLFLQAMPTMAGVLPAGIVNLGALQALQIEETGVSGPLPSGFSQLTSLRALTLRANPSLNGSLPPGLGNIAGLRGINLTGNAFDGTIPTSFGNAASLEVLNLSFNRLVGSIPPGLGQLPALRGLALGGNQLTGVVPSLAQLTQLRALMLGPNTLSGAMPALSLGNLEVLYARQAGFTGAVPDLSAGAKLIYVNLSDNAFDAGPVPGWAGALPAVQSLGLNHTQRTGAIPNLGATASRLFYLGLGGNAFDAGQVPRWIGSMTQLTGLDLAATGRTGDIPSFLANLTLLEALELSDNPFDAGHIPGVVTKLPRLRRLGLANTRRRGQIPAALWNLPLSSLRLEDNHLTGPLSEDVQKPLLYVLDLSRNAMEGPLPRNLSTQVRMESMDLSGNRFSGEVPQMSSVLDEDMIDGTRTDPFGRVYKGCDLRYNELTSSDTALIAALKAKHPGGVDFRRTQTVPPANVRARPLSTTSIRVLWRPIAFTGDGRYIISMSQSATGPFSPVATVSPKDQDQADVTSLAPATTYFFQVQTESAASRHNRNVLLSDPSAVASASTN